MSMPLLGEGGFNMISVFDLYKIGIGPSSSHTTGPMVAARAFREEVAERAAECTRLRVWLYGSLAWTGKGHGTDRAVCLGLLGEKPHEVDPDTVEATMRQLAYDRAIRLDEGRKLEFDPQSDIVIDRETTPQKHPNAMRFIAVDADGNTRLESVFYSIGGGFVEREGEAQPRATTALPYSFKNVAQLLELTKKTGMSIAAIQHANECALRAEQDVESGLDAIRGAMFACIDKGFSREGLLPGSLKVKRRAKALADALIASNRNDSLHPHEKMDWVSAYALAVNEENAAGGRVVTAPTNGAAGIVPAVLRYYREFYTDYSRAGARVFLLTSAAIGAIIKQNASISGAEVGCQGEVGSAAAMAAAGLAAVFGGSPAQIENAAEIALEHHLGMTCDPIGGLVQIPCIERNAIGAHKAIAAASLAIRGDGTHRVTLDEVVETMRQTGVDMQSKYKETSLGGLAVNVAEC